MRLKDPLQGIKMGIGHLMVHIVFFIINVFFVKRLNHVDEHPVCEDYEEKQVLAYYLLRYAHLAAAISIVIYLSMKQMKYYSLAQFILVVFGLLTYLVAVMYSIFIFSKCSLYKGLALSSYRVWIYIEIIYFQAWILSIAFFLLLAYFFKYKSVFKQSQDNQNEDAIKDERKFEKARIESEALGPEGFNLFKIAQKEIGEQARRTKHWDIWSNKDTDDFLKYLKWEAFNFGYFLSMAFMDQLMFYHFYLEYWGEMKPKDMFFLIGLNGAYIISRILDILLFQLQLMRGRTFKIRCDNRENAWKVFSYVFKFSTFLYGEWCYNYVEGLNRAKERIPLLRQWVSIEQLAMFSETFYFYFLGFAIRLTTKTNQMLIGAIAKTTDTLTTSQVGRAPPVSSEDSIGLIQKGSLNDEESEVDFEDNSEAADTDYLAIIRQRVCSKDNMIFQEDLFSLTLLCYLKRSKKRMMLTESKKAQFFHTSLLIFCTQLVMIVTMVISMFLDDGFKPSVSSSQLILLVKLPCGIALHLTLFPEVKRGMDLMKFAVNQPEQFTGSGSHISFFLGFMQYLISVVAEVTNLYMLTFQGSVQSCIMHFVTLKVICELGRMYYTTMTDEKTKDLFKDPPPIKRRGRDIVFRQRPCMNKCERALYKGMRALYVSLIFYFVPFFVWYFNVILANYLESED